MQNLDIIKRLTITMLAVLLQLSAAPGALAQAGGGGGETDEIVEEIIVTGSRIKRTTYSSIAPLQIISAEGSREVGLIDAADILQESVAAGGQQVDLTFQGYVLDNGPGSSTINLRGLGEARTLVLVNGRRMAPSGVEGAPFAANLNVIPASLVQQYDVLLDGASSIYGSDAIGGVANIILRKDFDGVEVNNYVSVPEQSGGMQNTLSVVWGKSLDRGFVGFGAEYRTEDNVRLRDRKSTAGCDRNHEIDENGRFRYRDSFYTTVYGMDLGDCRLGLLAARVAVPEAGSVYYTPGISNGGWPGFSESVAFGTAIDTDGDGAPDVNYRDYDLNGKASQQNSDLFAEASSRKIMGYGEYTLEGAANLTPYFEVIYSENKFFANSAEGQFFPVVPALNPYNICNPDAEAVEGVDCGLAYDELMNSQAVIDSVMASFGCDPSTGGSCDQTVGALGAQSVQPIVSVAGDRNFTDVDSAQVRTVIGLRGDMPWLTLGSLDNWSFDVYASLSKSWGTSARRGIRDDRLNLALGAYSSTNTPCENDLGVAMAANVVAGCVPVNMFAPSLYPVGVVTGDFASAAERNYLFDDRDFDTKYKQAIFSGSITGDIFDLPAGTVSAVLGVESRNDDIASIPDDVARDGLFFGFFSDGGATGDKNTDELFIEVELPLFATQEQTQELTLNVSGRYTDDEYYGSGRTGSTKLGWRIGDALLVRATYGSSFRAPNNRELFLKAQSGFGNIFDPCFIPEDAINEITGEYVPANDTREAHVLANCLANGVNPILADNGGFNIFSTEVSSGGSLGLNAEESRSWTAGISFEQPFTTAFALGLGVTYYEIDIEQTIIEPSGQFMVNDCYNSLTGNSAFCSRIERDLTDPTLPVISLLDSGFINREAETARGVDINLVFEDRWRILRRDIDVSMDVVAHRQLERSTLFIDDDGLQDINHFEKEWGFPKWRSTSQVRFDYNDWRLTWSTNYISSIQQDRAGVDDFDEAITGLSDTCEGPPNDVLCRDYGDADNYFKHTMSLYRYHGQWSFGIGIRNLFDAKPPVVDGTEVLSINNTPIGYGYDLGGRTYFLSAGFNFGGTG